MSLTPVALSEEQQHLFDYIETTQNNTIRHVCTLFYVLKDRIRVRSPMSSRSVSHARVGAPLARPTKDLVLVAVQIVLIVLVKCRLIVALAQIVA